MSSGYQEARDGAAFDERRDRGRVLVTGGDAQSFLHALVTNDVASLTPGSGCDAALLTPQGRMITDMTVRMTAPGSLLLVVPSDAAAPLAARLDKAIFSEDAEVADVSSTTVQFSVTGPAAHELAAAAVEDVFGALMWRSNELGLAGTDVVVPAGSAEQVRSVLARSAAPLSAEARTVLRLEAGRPEFGVDMTKDTIPLEANLLDRAISTTKGCYVGQEVIIRVLHRGGGRVAKNLVRLRFAGHDVPPAGAVLATEGRDIGRVTSAAWSPREAAVIGLGYVHRDFVESGLEVDVAGGGTAVVTEL
jgi:tRNA-modifying protein YgfZ